MTHEVFSPIVKLNCAHHQKHCLAISKGTTPLQLFALVAFFLWFPTNAFTVRPPVTDSHYTSNQILMSSINQYLELLLMMIQIGHQSHVIAFTLQNNYQKYHLFVFVKTPQYTLHSTSFVRCLLLCKSTLSQLQFMSQWPDLI